MDFVVFWDPHQLSAGGKMDPRAAPQVRLDSEQLRSFIAEYVGVDVREVTDEAHLCDDLGLDWLDQLELLVVIEDEFAHVDFFANTTAASLERVGDLLRQVEYLNALRASRSAA